MYVKKLQFLYFISQYNRLINDMLAVYNTAEICAYNEPFKCGLHLQPELQFIMSHSRDWDELQHIWTEWRRNTGRRIRDLYEQLVDLTNQAARLNSEYLFGLWLEIP
jgi:peptidyl-dipeptidase A